MAIGAEEVTRITGCAGSVVPKNSLVNRDTTCPAAKVIDAAAARVPLMFSACRLTLTSDAVIHQSEALKLRSGNTKSKNECVSKRISRQRYDRRSALQTSDPSQTCDRRVVSEEGFEHLRNVEADVAGWRQLGENPFNRCRKLLARQHRNQRRRSRLRTGSAEQLCLQSHCLVG